MVQAKMAGETSTVEKLCKQILQRHPMQPDALFFLAGIERKRRAYQKAISLYNQAIHAKPNTPLFYTGLGRALYASNHLHEAANAFQYAFQLGPDIVPNLNSFGKVLVDLGQWERAIFILQKSLNLKPEQPEVLNDLGTAYNRFGHLKAAEQAYRSSIRIDPSSHVHNNLGLVLQRQGYWKEAKHHFLHSVELAPQDPHKRSNLLLHLHYKPHTTAELFIQHQRWEEQFGQSLRALWPKRQMADPTQHPLRVGLISPDFGQHPIGFFLTRWLENRQEDGLVVFCYSDWWEKDHWAQRMETAADHWYTVHGWSDKQLLEKINTDRINILIDLAGHTADNRLTCFALKAAPIQMTWAGYVGTTGLAAMDYLIADIHHVPEGEENDYSEKILRLPNDYICYTPPEDSPEIETLPATINGFIQFCCFQNPSKVNPEMIALWSKILLAVPTSRLCLKYSGYEDEEIQRRMMEQWLALGMDAERLILKGASSHKENLIDLSKMDIALDTMPYSGGLTTCEALWMGVPVITCTGETFAGRHATSHLMQVGLQALVTSTPADYIQCAVALAEDLPRLIALRTTLRDRILHSPLCDGILFAKHFSQAMYHAWHQTFSPLPDSTSR